MKTGEGKLTPNRRKTQVRKVVTETLMHIEMRFGHVGKRSMHM